MSEVPFGLTGIAGAESSFGQLAEAEAELTWIKGVAERAKAVALYKPSNGLADWGGLHIDYQEPAADSFRTTCELEIDLPRLAWSSLISGDAQEHLCKLTDAYHEALPFVGSQGRELAKAYLEAEAELIQEGYSDPPGLRLETIYGLHSRPIQYMAGGRRQAIYCLGLFNRWWDWQRGINEYEDHGTRFEAQTAIGGIGGTLSAMLGDQKIIESPDLH